MDLSPSRELHVPKNRDASGAQRGWGGSEGSEDLASPEGWPGCQLWQPGRGRSEIDDMFDGVVGADCTPTTQPEQ